MFTVRRTVKRSHVNGMRAISVQAGPRKKWRERLAKAITGGG